VHVCVEGIDGLSVGPSRVVARKRFAECGGMLVQNYDLVALASVLRDCEQLEQQRLS
jgi:hypothetical protein